jgi:hypothetical protein
MSNQITTDEPAHVDAIHLTNPGDLVRVVKLTRVTPKVGKTFVISNTVVCIVTDKNGLRCFIELATGEMLMPHRVDSLVVLPPGTTVSLTSPTPESTP